MSVDKLCCSATPSGQMFLSWVGLVVSIFLGRSRYLSHWWPGRYLHSHNFHTFGALRSSLGSRQNALSLSHNLRLVTWDVKICHFVQSSFIWKLHVSYFYCSHWIQSLSCYFDCSRINSDNSVPHNNSPDWHNSPSHAFRAIATSGHCNEDLGFAF